VFEPDLAVLYDLPWRADRDLPDGLHAAADGLDPPPVFRSLAWTVAISARQDELAAAMSRTPGARYTAVGFLDRSRERQIPGTFPGFGVIVYTDDTGDTAAAPAGRLEPITADDVPFTVVTRPGLFSAESTVGHRPAGQVACWATSRRGARQGWLTARHCASALGRVVDSAPDCTDAALVSTGKARAGTVRSAFAGLAAGLTVDMHLGSQARVATVLDVSTDFGMLKSGKFPLRFSTDQAGKPGDSGSLLTEKASADPLGIYLGSFVPAANPTGPKAGVGLSIYQLEQMMDLEVYL